MANLLTIGEIERRLREEHKIATSRPRLEYVIRTRKIQPASRAGMAYVYDEAALERIASEMRLIEAEQQGRRFYAY